MPAELYSMTGAAGTLQLGNRTLFLSQFSISAIGQIQAWLKERLPRPFAVVRQALQDLEGLPPEVFKRAEESLLRAAHIDAKADVIAVESEAAVAQLSSGPGVSLLIWLAARPMHPELTYEVVQELVNQENILDLKRKVDLAMGLLKDSMEAKGAFGNPTMPATPTPVQMAPLNMQDITIIGGNGRTGQSSSSR